MPDGVSPLLDVFLELRQREFPLGVREYLLALDALACGLGVGSREDLVFVCQTLWAKSVEEQLHVKDVLDRLLPPLRTNEELEAPSRPECAKNSSHWVREPRPSAGLPRPGRCPVCPGLRPSRSGRPGPQPP